MQGDPSTGGRINSLIVCLLLVIASVLFAYQTRHSQCWACWGRCVLENWREVGYWNLHGHPAINPGGIHAGEKPVFYVAYRGLSLLPMYWLYLLTGNLNTALVLAYWLLTIVLVTAIWWFFGKNPWALLIASAFCLSPAYVRLGVMNWDPVPGTTLIGIPVMLILVRSIAVPPQSRARSFLVLTLVAVYSQIEWATVFALGVGWAACAVLLWPSKRRQLMLFTVLMVCLVSICALATMWKKSGGGSGVSQVLSSYTIGSVGYDRHGMSWPLALKRWGPVCAIGLLPLWIAFFPSAWPSFRKNPRETLVACLPLWAAGAEILVLRNAMAHHQWISLPAVALGIMLSLYLLRRPAASGTAGSDAAPVGPGLTARATLLFVIGATLYCLAIVSIFRANDAEVQSLMRLAATNTPRRALIVVGTDLGRIINIDDLAGIIDRRCIPMDTTMPPPGELSEAGAYLINSTPLAGVGPLVAQSTATKGDLAAQLLSWYRTRIARKNFRLQQVETCYLYRLESH